MIWDSRKCSDVCCDHTDHSHHKLLCVIAWSPHGVRVVGQMLLHSTSAGKSNKAKFEHEVINSDLSRCIDVCFTVPSQMSHSHQLAFCHLLEL